jgi:5'-3' exonuclease
MQKKKTLLIDGDVLVYQIGCAVERPVDWGDGQWSLHADAHEATQRLDAEIKAWQTLLQADHAIVALSCKTEEGYRRALCPSYKSNRSGNRKPVVHQALRKHMEVAYGAVAYPRLEADDVLGILATGPHQDDRIICSIDKDFQGVPCSWFNIRKPDGGVRQVSAEQAAWFHAMQTLMGDAVDGYQGIPGVGPKTAEKMLHGVAPADYWPTIVAAYQKAGLSEAVALLNARMARILRAPDYDAKTQQITLWTPPPTSPTSSPTTTPATAKKSPSKSPKKAPSA